MSDSAPVVDGGELLEVVLMRAAANRAAQIKRQATAALVAEIKVRNARMLKR